MRDVNAPLLPYLLIYYVVTFSVRIYLCHRLAEITF